MRRRRFFCVCSRRVCAHGVCVWRAAGQCGGERRAVAAAAESGRRASISPLPASAESRTRSADRGFTVRPTRRAAGSRAMRVAGRGGGGLLHSVSASQGFVLPRAARGVCARVRRVLTHISDITVRQQQAQRVAAPNAHKASTSSCLQRQSQAPANTHPAHTLQLSSLRSIRKASMPFLASVSAAQAPEGPPPITATRSLRPSSVAPFLIAAAMTTLAALRPARAARSVCWTATPAKPAGAGALDDAAAAADAPVGPLSLCSAVAALP